MFKKGVYQRLGVTLKRWLTPKSWSTLEKKSDFLNKTLKTV